MAQAQAQIQQNNHETIDTFNPATGEIYKTYTLHTDEECKEIADKAHEAFLSWRETSFEERAKILNKTSELLTCPL